MSDDKIKKASERRKKKGIIAAILSFGARSASEGKKREKIFDAEKVRQFQLKKRKK